MKTNHASVRPLNNVDELIQGLEWVIAEAIAQSNRMGYFAALYRQVSLRIKQYMAAGRFDDGNRMDRFAAEFGNRYFQALATYQQGGKPSKAWKVAFQSTEDPQLIIVQHLLLGINAHVNLDLGMAAAVISPGDSILTLERDFNLINEILVELLDGLQDRINDFSPWMTLLDLVGGRHDEGIANFSIVKAREEAWESALLLAYQTPEQRQGAEIFIDRKAALLAQRVAHPGRIFSRAMTLVQWKEADNVVDIIEALNSLA